MERRPTSASWRGWLQGAGWTLALAALLVAAAGLVTSTAIHAGTVTTPPAGPEKHLAERQADGTPAFPEWGWEWQQDPDSGPMARPTHLR
jgi:hypothetical protein